MSNGEHLIRLAKLAEQAERYEDMKNAMVDYVKSHKQNLQTEERNLLSVAFKNVVGLKRSSLKILTSIKEKESSEKKMGMCKNIRETVMKELEAECEQVIKLLDDVLIPNTTESEAKVFYYKMKGDYLRYLAEADVSMEQSKDNQNHITEAKAAYDAAHNIATADLASTHPIRLGLALNFSVFYYEILNQSEKACHTAKKAFDDAIGDLDTVGEESYKDSTLIMQLLRDNLTLWTSDDTQGQEEDQ